MKIYLVIATLLLAAFSVEARESSILDNTGAQYTECVAVSLFTIAGRELNSIIDNKRTIETANAIPEGWAVIGVTTKSENEVSRPYLVICH